MTRPVDARSAGDLESLLAAVIAVLEQDPSWAYTDRDGLAAALGGALQARGLPGELDAPLRAGGRAELLLSALERPGQGVAVLPAAHGATDAIRARVRALAAHSEIAAVVIASPRPRHRALAGERGGIAVRVALLPPPSPSNIQVTDHLPP